MSNRNSKHVTVFLYVYISSIMYSKITSQSKVACLLDNLGLRPMKRSRLTRIDDCKCMNTFSNFGDSPGLTRKEEESGNWQLKTQQPSGSTIDSKTNVYCRPRLYNAHPYFNHAILEWNKGYQSLGPFKIKVNLALFADKITAPKATSLGVPGSGSR